MSTDNKLADALRGIVELGKRDLTNPKYDPFFDAAREAITEHDELRGHGNELLNDDVIARIAYNCGFDIEYEGDENEAPRWITVDGDDAFDDLRKFAVALAEHAASLAAPPAQGEWQPIETAPRDSSAVLVAFRSAFGEWRVREAWWRTPFEAAPAERCWWCYDKTVTLLDASVHGVGASHWMPLPPPPGAAPQPASAPVQVDDARSWPEDAQHENGDYECECMTCGCRFVGHKRRHVCKVCAHPPAPAADGAGELPPLPKGDAFCDPADWSEESIGLCGAWSEHLSINSRYTMPLYTESSVRTYTRAAIAALRQPVPDAVREEVSRVARHVAMAVEYIDKQYPDARMLDRAPIMSNLRRWSKRLESALALQQESRNG